MLATIRSAMRGSFESEVMARTSSSVRVRAKVASSFFSCEQRNGICDR